MSGLLFVNIQGGRSAAAVNPHPRLQIETSTPTRVWW
jgi:hypothetical protein